MINDVESVDWSFNSSSNDVNVMFDTFYSRLSNIIDRHIPIKKLSAKEIKQLSKPWITSGIRRSIRIKNKLYKRFIKTQSAYYHTKFKLYRNKLNHLIKISKVDYYRRYFSSNTTHIKNIWKGIKQIIALKPLCNNIPTSFLLVTMKLLVLIIWPIHSMIFC